MIAMLIATTVESGNNYSGKAEKINSALLQPVLLSLQRQPSTSVRMLLM